MNRFVKEIKIKYTPSTLYKGKNFSFIFESQTENWKLFLKESEDLSRCNHIGI